LRDTYNKALNIAEKRLLQIRKLKKGISNKRCIWNNDGESFNTECGRTFKLINATLKENNIKYCMFCGKQIKENIIF